jgi:hypothetical protein
MDVYTWLLANASLPGHVPGPAYLGFSTPWSGDTGDTIYGGIPVMISDDPTWPADRWAYVEDGVMISTGYGEPLQRQIGA